MGDKSDAQHDLHKDNLSLHIEGFQTVFFIVSPWQQLVKTAP